MRRLMVAALAAMVLLQGPTASAATTTVVVQNMAFSPRAVAVPLGGTVTWSFRDPFAHTTTSNQGFWNSGPRSAGQSFSVTFPSAGVFWYRCAIHPMMTGYVRASIRLLPTPGGWYLKWSTLTGGSRRVFDVQWRRSTSSTWLTFERRTTWTGALFPSHAAGTYVVRARTDNPANGQDSGWAQIIVQQGFTG